MFPNTLSVIAAMIQNFRGTDEFRFTIPIRGLFIGFIGFNTSQKAFFFPSDPEKHILVLEVTYK